MGQPCRTRILKRVGGAVALVAPQCPPERTLSHSVCPLAHPQRVRNTAPQALTTIPAKTTLKAVKRRRGTPPARLSCLTSEETLPEVGPGKSGFLFSLARAGSRGHPNQSQHRGLGLRDWLKPTIYPLEEARLL